MAIGETVEHTGVIVYQQYGHSPREFVRAVTRIDRYIAAEEFRDHVEWLEDWL